MAVLNFNTTNDTTQTQRNPNTRTPFGNMQSPNDQPRAKLWLNIGYEMNGRFVNLPIGTPVDTMKQADVRGQNEDWIKFQTARNAMLEALQQYGMSLEPGQEVEIPNLVIKLRRVNEEVEVIPADNEYALDLRSMLPPVSPSGSSSASKESKEPELVE